MNEDQAERMIDLLAEINNNIVDLIERIGSDHEFGSVNYKLNDIFSRLRDIDGNVSSIDSSVTSIDLNMPS